MDLRKKNKTGLTKLELNLIIWQFVAYISIFLSATNIYWILPFISSIIIMGLLGRVYQQMLLSKEVMSLLQMEDD